MLEKMNEQRIEPHKVTKPIQLLAAWMVGLVVTNSSFLIAAVQMADESWERGCLVIAAVANVPVFLFALFLLQTRFRAELQEDTYYSEYLSKKSSNVVRVDKNTEQDLRINRVEKFVTQLTAKKNDNILHIQNTNDTGVLDWSSWPIALNRQHPRFKEIRQSLREAKIPLTSFFGNQEVPPKKWVIAIGNQLPINHKIALLKTVLPYDFDGFQLWNPLRDAEENEDVYIGSYGIYSYAPINDELMEMLTSVLDEVDLREFYERNLIVSEMPRFK